MFRVIWGKKGRPCLVEVRRDQKGKTLADIPMMEE
jgi:hypothetical protein